MTGKANEKPLKDAVKQLKAYFSGKLRNFDLELAPEGTDFQKKVWNALRRVKFGATASYGEIATQIGNPAASRAVGMANGRNPLSIIVPCHRIIGSTGNWLVTEAVCRIKNSAANSERSLQH